MASKVNPRGKPRRSRAVQATPRPKKDDAPAVWADPKTLKPWAQNPRSHNVEEIVASVKRFGWGAPLVARKENREVIEGHGRLEAALAMKLERVPVRFLDVSEKEAHALALAGNQLAGEWTDGLGAVLTDLSLGGVELEGLGWGKLELVQFLADPNAGDDPGPSAPPKAARSKLGEVYELGPHRLLAGDATDAEAVAGLFGGDRANVVVTSPPYLEQREYGGHGHGWLATMTGALVHVPVEADGQVFVNLGLVHQDGEVVTYWDPWIVQMKAAGWRFFGWYVWDKISATFKANDGRPWVSHEWVFHFNRKSVACVEHVACKHAGEQRGGLGQRKPDGRVAALSTPGAIKDFRPPDTVIRIQRETDNRDPNTRRHPARFPVALPSFFLETWPGDLVYDPFGGSGTTLIASAQLARRCYMVELDPSYCDVIRIRWTTYARSLNQDPGTGALDAALPPE